MTWRGSWTSLREIRRLTLPKTPAWTTLISCRSMNKQRATKSICNRSITCTNSRATWTRTGLTSTLRTKTLIKLSMDAATGCKCFSSSLFNPKLCPVPPLLNNSRDTVLMTLIPPIWPLLESRVLMSSPISWGNRAPTKMLESPASSSLSRQTRKKLPYRKLLSKPKSRAPLWLPTKNLT